MTEDAPAKAGITLEEIADALAIDIAADSVMVITPDALPKSLALYTPNLFTGVTGSAAGTAIADLLERSLPPSAELVVVTPTVADPEIQRVSLERLRVIGIEAGTAVYVGAFDARVEAIGALYAADILGADDVVVTNLSKRAATFASGVWVNRSDIDVVIGAASRGWRVERMPAVDRNVLRLGTFELLFTDLAKGVILDEAVGLAKVYSTAKSASFVNGVLDAVAKEGHQTTSM